MIDTRDFEELVRRHQNAVCAVAFSVLRDRGRSEEIAQEAFLVAWQKLPAMSPPPTMPAWICGIARNLARNAARRKQEIAMDAEPSSSQTPLQIALDREADALVASALDALSDDDREVIVLYYRGDGSLAEVAAALHITEVAARQRLHRGRTRLSRMLATVETTLRASRPGPAFTATCVAALAAGVVPRADAAPAARPRAGVAATVTGGVLAIVAIGWAIHHAIAPAPVATARQADASPNAPITAPMTSAPTIRRLDASSRAALLETIRATHEPRSAPGSTATVGAKTAPELAPPPVKVYDFSDVALEDLRVMKPPKPGPLVKTTIRYAIQQIQPLLLECYQAALPRLVRPVGRARKDGTISVTLHLIGEPDVGTIVESVTFGGDALLVGDAQLVECMRETLMTVELQPMSAAETWDVIYPFVVR